MQELEVDLAAFNEIFSQVQSTPFAIIEINSEQAAEFSDRLGLPVRRCYISESALQARVEATSMSERTIVESKLPDRGSTMAGDFGEILTALYLAAREHPGVVLDPKKWRLKQDRLKPAPYSDVVQMVLPHWPMASIDDRVICAEIKTKSTSGASTPIASAIADSEKDSSRRLVKTLNWLKERAIDTGLSTVSIDQLDRFIHPIQYPEATREFRAVAVICASLVADELVDVQAPPPDERALIVISVPNLKDIYERVYDAALLTADDVEVLE